MTIDERYLASSDMDAEIKKYKGNWRNFQSFGWADKPEDPNNWTIVYTVNRDSNNIDQSNAAYMAKELEPYLQEENPDIVAEHHGHWAVGWVDGYSIRVTRDGADAEGAKPTEAFRKWLELQARLEDYPIFDEEDLSERDRQDVVSNITSEGRRITRDDVPDDWAVQVYAWFSENDERLVDADSYPSKEDIVPALKALNFLDPDYEE